MMRVPLVFGAPIAANKEMLRDKVTRNGHGVHSDGLLYTSYVSSTWIASSGCGSTIAYAWAACVRGKRCVIRWAGRTCSSIHQATWSRRALLQRPVHSGARVLT